MSDNSADLETANAFATSWNNLPSGSIYTFAQFLDWFEPVEQKDVSGKTVLELGCGNGSLMVHIQSWRPEMLVGVDLGPSVLSANKNMQETNFQHYKIVQDDLATYEGEAHYDLVYCIGVLHHLKDPISGFRSVLKNTKNGGRFHCWVYAKEGNFIVIYFIDPLRRVTSKLPWWINKYLISTPLASVFYLYAHTITKAKLRAAPLHKYCEWICAREFSFFRHVAFDQLVTPNTKYISKDEIDKWLKSDARIDTQSTYIIQRNGNSWKFGGRISCSVSLPDTKIVP